MVARCYWHSVARSESNEGIIFRQQNKEIPFDVCKNYCEGDNMKCLKYKVVQEKELKEVGRLEEFCI